MREKKQILHDIFAKIDGHILSTDFDAGSERLVSHVVVQATKITHKDSVCGGQKY